MASQTDLQKPSSVEKESPVESGANGGKEVPLDGSRSGKLRILCLHGFRTSGKILARQIAIANWPPLMDGVAELTFMDAPCPARGPVVVEKQFEGPYFEWHQISKDNSEVYGFDKGAKHFSDFVSLHGPFDGLLGFSQGGLLAAAWMGFYESGHAMGPNMSSIKFLIIVGGGRSTSRTLRPAYSDTIKCPSIHFIGDKCFMKPYGESLVSIFKDPVVIRHPFDHLVPRLGASEGQVLRDFLLKQQKLIVASRKGNHPSPARSLL